MKYHKGECLFECAVWMDGRLHIGVITVDNCDEKIDKAGRSQGFFYDITALNFTRNNEQKIRVKEKELDANFHRSAVEAVSDALSNFLDSRRKDTPEERFLQAVFGKGPDSVKITVDELPKVIRNLQDFNKLFEQAFKMDAEYLGDEKEKKEAKDAE